MKHIGYNWYTKIMKWNPHVPKNISFFFILILFIKRKKFDNPKVQISSKPKTIFSIHPVSRRNRAKLFPCEIKINKKSRVLERRFLETWVPQPEPNGRIFFHFTVKTLNILTYTANVLTIKTTGTGNCRGPAGKICTIYGKGL